MSSDFLMDSLSKIFIFYIPFLFSLSFHEFSHAWVAYKKGDSTAYHLGRMNLNPLSHMDLLGTVFLPLAGLLSGWSFIFGWAKPVPVDSRNLKDVKRDMFWIAFAGPLSNMLLAVIGSFIFAVSSLIIPDKQLILQLLSSFVFLNLLLCFFNLIPIHPLDGGKVLERFLPYHVNRFLLEKQMMLNIGLIAFFLLGGFRFLLGPIIAIQEFLFFVFRFIFLLIGF